MIELVLTIDRLGLLTRGSAILDAQRDFTRALAAHGLPKTQAAIDAALNADPGPVVWPFEFATERSRRWYFANYETRLPYQRTGSMRRWKALIRDVSDSGFVVLLRNEEEGAIHVFGPRQVPGHRKTGWPMYQSRLMDLRSDAWTEVGSFYLEVVPMGMTAFARAR